MEFDESVELYKKHEKEVKQHLLMDMTRIFDIDDMIHAVIWKLTCNAIDNKVLNKERKEYINNILDRHIDNWV